MMQTRNDGLFYVDGEPYIHTFVNNKGEKDFRLERVTYSPGRQVLPPIESWFKLENHDTGIMILGEPGSGIQVFCSWLTCEQNDWKVIHTKGPVSACSIDQDRIIVDRTTKTIFQELDDSDFIAKLAARFDGREHNREPFSFICLSNEANYVQLSQDHLYSYLSDRAHVYRLPRFNIEDICTWLDKLLTKHGLKDKFSNLQKRQLAIQIHRNIAGQPVLTHMLFRNVDDALNNNSKNIDVITLSDFFNKQFINIRTHPPKVVDRWKHQLKDLLKPNSEARDIMHKYLSGATHTPEFPYTEHDKVLFNAGWLGFAYQDEETKTWGIASELHRYWGRQVLLELI